MKRVRRGAVVAAAVTMLLAGACADDPAAPPIPGMLLVSLNTPAADDAAVLLRVQGPGIQGVASTNSNHRLFWRLAADDEANVIVLGGLASGPVLTVQVPDVRAAAEYTVTVAEVAAANDALRASLEGYAATVARSGVATD